MKSVSVIFVFIAGLYANVIAQNSGFGQPFIQNETWSAPPADTITNAMELRLLDSVNVNNTATVAVISATEVDMLPGFTAGAFSASGKYDAKINTVAVPIALLSPGDLSNICPFQRMEIGIGIPPGVPNLLHEIDSFTWHPRRPPYPAGVINPFDPDELSIVATFTATDPSGHHKTFTRNGFYYQDVSVVYPHSANENYLVTDDYSYPFRVRFAPPFYGSWSVTISIIVNKTQVYTSMPGSFEVVNSCTNQGFITADNSNWHFIYDYNNYGSGATFFPTGQDLKGPVQDGYSGWNPPYSHEIFTNSDPSLIRSGTDTNANLWWLSNFAMSNDDYDYQIHRNEMKNVASMGANFVRMFTMWGGYGMDYGSPVICDYDPASCYELDSTLLLAENKNLYLLLTLENEQNLSTTGLYGYAERWGPKGRNPNMPHDTTYWNPYYDYLINVKKMTDPDPSYFFSDADLQKYYKDKLRYIEARWGYSPNIFGYEFFNEMDKVGYDSALGTEYSANPTVILPAINGWVDTMTNYVHSFYPSHMVTVGYASGPAYNSGHGNETDYSPEYIDFIDQHSYTSNLPENSDRGTYILHKYFYNPNEYDKTVIEKPRIYGEEGVLCGEVEEDSGCADTIVRHNDEWASAFMTSGAGFYWGDNFDPTSNMTDYHKISDFFSYLAGMGYNFQNMQLSDINQYDNENSKGYQTFYLVDAAAKGDGDDNDTSAAKYINLEIGWIQNTGYNWEYNPGGCSLGCGTSTTNISQVASSSIELSSLVNPANFQIYIWDPYADSLEGTYQGTTAITSSLEFPINLGTSPYATIEPDYAYFLKKTSDIHSTTKNGVQIIRLPNDTIYLPSFDSLSFPDSRFYPAMPGKFEWDFGNGITSTKPYAKWLYNHIGEYETTVNYTDSIKKILVERLYVVLENNIPQLATDSTFTIVPNPTTGIFTIFTKGSFPINEIDIEDATGRRCFSQLNPSSHIFNISPLATGMYIVHIRANGMTITKKLIKYD